MESLASEQIGDALNAVSECDSIDVVSETPVRRKKKVTFSDPLEFPDSPDDNKRELRMLITMESLVSEQIEDSLKPVSECDSIDVVSESPVVSKKKVKFSDPFEFPDSPETDDYKRELHKLITMESLVSEEIGDALNAVSECDSIDVVSETPVKSKKKVKFLDPWDFPDLAKKDDERELHPHQLITMESLVSHQFGDAFDVISECDSVDVVCESPVDSKNKIKLVDPWEFPDSPEAGDHKRELHPHTCMSILGDLSSGDSAVLGTIQQCTENGTQSTFPTMACPPQWHPMSAVIPGYSPGPNGMQGLPAFAMSNPGVPEPGAIVPYVGLADDGTPFFIPGSGVLVPAASGEMPAHQIHTPGSGLPQGIVVAASSTTLHIPQQMAEEATRKRELRLMKNREAAKACRLRRKEYIRCLESHNAMLEIYNRQLMQELEAYRNMYRERTTS